MKVSLKQIAEKARISKQAIHKRAKKERWVPSFIGSKGQEFFDTDTIFYLKQLFSDSFPAVSQTVAVETLPTAGPFPNADVVTSSTISTRRDRHGKTDPALNYIEIPENAKKIALARIDLIRAWEEYREKEQKSLLPLLQQRRTLTEIDNEFLNGYNSGILCPQIFETLGEKSLRTLYAWKSALSNTYDYHRLLSGWFLARNSQPSIPDDILSIFMGLLLHPNKIKIGTAIRLTRYYFERRGITFDISDMTFRRHAERFKKKNYDRWILMREGQKALRDKVEPFIERDPSLLNVGDVLVADGHRLNFKIINPFTGKPCRATLVGYIDWKSYDLAGYEIMLEENIQCIASALRNSIIKLGRIPKITYQDNGKAFRARFFTSTESFEESGLYGLFARLGIIPVFAQPYNARAKIIERWFKEFSDTFERMFPSFVGTNINDKPAHMLRNEKFHKAIHKEYIPTIDETVGLIDAWLDFHRSQQCPHVPGKTIGEVFNEGRGQGINIDELDDLMMVTKKANIGRNGIRFLNADYYDDNLYGLRETVLIKYSLFDLSKIKVYSHKGEFLCIAERRMPVHPMAEHLGDIRDVEMLKHRISQQRRLEKKTIQGVKELVNLGKEVELDWQNVINVSPKIIEKLEHVDVMIPHHIEENIPDEAVRQTTDIQTTDMKTIELKTTDIPDRPFFGLDTIARYEWHLKNGFHSQEDYEFKEYFEKSNEYRMLQLLKQQ